MLNQNRIASLGESLKELNFNISLPAVKNKNTYLNEKRILEFDLEKRWIAPEYKIYIKIHYNNNKKNYNLGKKI